MMPIVSLTIDHCCLLVYEDGISNFRDWLKMGNDRMDTANGIAVCNDKKDICEC